MKRSYLVPSGEYSSETTLLKSKFITTIRRIQSLSEMRWFYNEIRSHHPKANHNCWAAIAGPPEDSNTYGFSDDGEPSGTAGKPILKVLQFSGKGQAGIIVTRYFGGIKLGTGGLVRAYTEATKTILEKASFIQFSKTVHLACSFPYEDEPLFRYILAQHGNITAKYVYTEKVTARLTIGEVELEEFRNQLQHKLGHSLYIDQT